ncbi:MAG TPA: Fe-S cluster assembly protein HesB [Chloroflexota bacterium]
MPQLERLEWLAPLSEGRGVTLSDDPAADLLLLEDPNALLLGVLYDSQFSTRRAFAVPLRLKERLGYLDMTQLANADAATLAEAFSQKPALHRFPRKYAELTQKLAQAVATSYGSDSSRIWREAGSVDSLADRLLALPAFGVEKTNWTIGMLGMLGLLPYDGWQDFRVQPRKRSSA